MYYTDIRHYEAFRTRRSHRSGKVSVILALAALLVIIGNIAIGLSDDHDDYGMGGVPHHGLKADGRVQRLADTTGS